MALQYLEFLVNSRPNLSLSSDKKLIFGLNKKVNFFKFFIPPFIAICSLILFSYSFVYFYSPFENKEKKELINP